MAEDYIYLGLIGLFLLLFVLYDFFTTTLVTSGAGLLSVLVIRFCKFSYLVIHHYCFRCDIFLATMGPFTVTVLILLWVFLIWFSWLLIFYSTLDGIVSRSTFAPADLGARIYYTGYVVATLGIGTSPLIDELASLPALWSSPVPSALCPLPSALYGGDLRCMGCCRGLCSSHWLLPNSYPLGLHHLLRPTVHYRHVGPQH